MEKFYPARNLTGWLGLPKKVWKSLFVEKIIIPEMSAPSGDPDANTGWLYCKDTGATPGLYFEDDTGSVTQIATTPTALDDVGDPDAAGSITCGTYAQIITSAKTDGDMFNIQGLGNFGDVSVMRIEQKTGNPTDGTVLEVISADANCDPLVVSANGKASAFIVGQDGNCSMSDNLTVTGTLAVTGVQTLTGLTTCTNGAKLGVGTIKTDTVSLTNGEIKALRAAPKTLVAAPGAGYFTMFLGATLLLDYGSNVLSETTDNLVIEYAASGIDASATIETTGFIDSAADAIATAIPVAVTGSKTNLDNVALRLLNSGDGEFGGNAGNDTLMRVEITYVIVPTGF